MSSYLFSISVLILYSGLFLRWSLAIKPANYALFACHAANIFAQSWQLYRGIRFVLFLGLCFDSFSASVFIRFQLSEIACKA